MNLKKYIKLRDDIDAKVYRTEKEEQLYQQLIQKLKEREMQEKADKRPYKKWQRRK